MNTFVDTANQLQTRFENHTIEETLALLAKEYPNQVVFSSSLGIEDQVITHFIFKNKLPIKVFTLDTGRLFEESYEILERTNSLYGQSIQVYFPESADIEKLMSNNGAYSFYESVEKRKECCFLRKVKPLKRALAGNAIWVTGIRAEQSENRQSLALFEADLANHLVKYNPLLHWSFEEVKSFVAEHQIPYNSLHDAGFVSIGCAPCTRAIQEGEAFRAGRWWWEDSKKECGLHIG